MLPRLHRTLRTASFDFSCSRKFYARLPSRKLQSLGITPYFSSASFLRWPDLPRSYASASFTSNPSDDEYCGEFFFPDEKSQKEANLDVWEEEVDLEPVIGDGGNGGGIVLNDVPWGERALSIAQETLLQFSDDLKLYAFTATPKGYIYVRLDKLSEKYGCPSVEEIENFLSTYKKQLDEVGDSGKIPDDLAVEVSSPSAERILAIPNDLERFKDLPMVVNYMEETSETFPTQPKSGIFMVDCVETESKHCVWKLADVKENRKVLGKGRPFNSKTRDWRLRLSFESHIKLVEVGVS